jgi:hypothetical protein
MIKWWQQRSLVQRSLLYAVAATLAFLMAAGVGATAALVVSGNLSWPTGERASREEPSPAGEQDNTPQHQQADANRVQQGKADAEQEKAATQQAQTTYVNRVGDIQSNSVETFLDSHDKLLHYDALTADDVEELQANQAALQGFTDQIGDLKPPQKYRTQKEVFLSAINELHEAAQLAYALAADPTSATQSGFEEFDSHVDKAATLLQRSNKTLARDYKTIEGVQRVSPS